MSSACPFCTALIPFWFKFCGNCGQKLPENRGAAGAEASRNERRDVTILFADVSGFTSMCEKMDPEEVHSLMNRIFEGLGKAINEEDGQIDKYIGDNVMALFGAPVAHENDPERACRAALGMQKFLGEFAAGLVATTGVTLRMRIGINSGLVLAGGIGSAVKMDYSVLGDSVNLASRLESKAPPGGILISEFVVRRIQGFHLGPPQELLVKGKEKPVIARQLLGEMDPFDHQQESEAPGPFVGRQPEITALQRLLRKSAPPWQAISIIGESGIGKTRLAEEALRSLAGRKPLRVVSSPETFRRPFGLFRRLIQEVIRRLAPGPEASQTESAFFAVFKESFSETIHPYLPALWHLAAPSRLAVPAPDADPKMLRQTLERGITHLLDAIPGKIPGAILFLDSFEYSDPSSRDFFQSFFQRREGPPMPLIVTTIALPIPPSKVHRQFSLSRLSSNESETLISALLPSHPMTAEQREDVTAKTAGVPLYIQEFSRWFRDWLSENTSADNRVSIPPNLRSLMASQLDKLSSLEKDFVCACSVQGREFDSRVGLLTAGVADPEKARAMIESLRHREHFTAGPSNNHHLLTFRQPLFQEACYEMLLLSRRKHLHATTAAALCRVNGGEAAVAPETLALHYERAELWELSAASKLQAGQRAESFGLAGETLRWLTEALANHNRIVTPTPDATTTRFMIQRGIARHQFRTGDLPGAETTIREMEAGASQPWQQAETQRILASLSARQGKTDAAEAFLQRSLELASQANDHPDIRQEIAFDVAELRLRRGQFPEAMAASTEFRKGQPADNLRQLIRADTLEGRILYAQGLFSKAQNLFLLAQENARVSGALSEQARAGNNLGNVARDLGRLEEARQYYLTALDIWAKIQDAEGIATIHNNLGNLAMSVGDFPLARTHHEESLKRWVSMKAVHGTATCQANLAIMAIEQENGVEAVQMAKQAIKTISESGNQPLLSLVMIIQGEGFLLQQRSDQARRIFLRVLRQFSPDKFGLAHAGAKRGLGRIALLNGKAPVAVAFFQEAEQGFLRLKRSQEVARTALWLGEALLQTGKKDQAQETVANARKQLSAMNARADLARADRLLEKISQG